MIREATVDDVDGVVDIAAMLYEAIGEPASGEWLDSARRAVLDRLGRDMHAFVADEGGEIVASCAATLTKRLPTPSNPDGAVAYVQWVGTTPDYRHRGLARAVMVALLERFDSMRVHDVQLHSTLVAEPLYRTLGFVTGALRPLRRSPCVGE